MKTQQHSADTYSSNKTSEIAMWTIAIIVLFLLATNLSATTPNFDFEDEFYINDIPFDTELISEQISINNLASYTFTDEAYIDDIPFDTEIISMEVSFTDIEFEEETINDIPFDTKWVVANYNHQLAMNQVFDFADEYTIDDIPFDTYCIATQNNNSACEWVATSKN